MCSTARKGHCGDCRWIGIAAHFVNYLGRDKVRRERAGPVSAQARRLSALGGAGGCPVYIK